MPCYNAERHLPTSLRSLVTQTYDHWELIAIDDGSTDGTLSWLRARSEPRLRVVSQANCGVSAARNRGLRSACGRYVAFLDADDSWDRSFLEKMVTALEQHPQAVLAYCGWQNVGLEGGRGLPFIPPDYERPDKRETLFAGCRWPIHAALTRRDAIVALGGFDTSLSNAEDYALWLRLASVAPVARVPEVLAYYHFHGDTQASANVARAALQFFEAQQRYLKEHPRWRAHLGRARMRELTLGPLRDRGFDSYWKRNLPAARLIFRAVMRRGYGTSRDWIYMLPSWLPEPWHLRILARHDRAIGGNAADPTSGAHDV